MSISQYTFEAKIPWYPKETDKYLPVGIWPMSEGQMLISKSWNWCALNKTRQTFQQTILIVSSLSLSGLRSMKFYLLSLVWASTKYRHIMATSTFVLSTGTIVWGSRKQCEWVAMFSGSYRNPSQLSEGKQLAGKSQHSNFHLSKQTWRNCRKMTHQLLVPDDRSFTEDFMQHDLYYSPVMISW